MTEEERQNYLIASEKLLNRLKDKEALQFFVEVVAKAAEGMLLHILDELEGEELKEGYRLIVELTAGFKVTREQLEKLMHWQTEISERIKARGLKRTTTEYKLDEIRRALGVTREDLARKDDD
jgi:hypothetical protein